jgi:murein DD-endopeptidase MepM/ murein hydrolase activator NlpD
VIDAIGRPTPGAALRPEPAADPKKAEEAKVQQEFEVMLVRQLLQDLKLPGMDGQAAMFSDLIEENLARQIVESRGLSGPVGGPAPSAVRPPRHHEHAPSGAAVAHRSSGFGWRADPFHGERKFHSGVDLSAPMGTPIGAARGGTVIHAGPAGGYGNLVIVDHGDGVTSRYAHCSSIEVAKGDPVSAGQRIARVGSTGRSTGPHLHFEVRNAGTAIDPESWLNGSKDSVAPIRLESTTPAPSGGRP